MLLQGSPQEWWLKKLPSRYLAVLEVGNTAGSHPAEVTGLAGAAFLSGAWRGKPVFFLLRLLGAACVRGSRPRPLSAKPAVDLLVHLGPPLLPPSPTLTDPCGDLGSTWILQDHPNDPNYLQVSQLAHPFPSAALTTCWRTQSFQDSWGRTRTFLQGPGFCLPQQLKTPLSKAYCI